MLQPDNDDSEEGEYLAKVRRNMEENKDLDEKIAKDRLKTKRIKKKVYLKKLMGIPDKEAALDYGDESDEVSQQPQQDDESVEESPEEEPSVEPPRKRKKNDDLKEAKALRLLSQSMF
jgi:hypothetical protein